MDNNALFKIGYGLYVLTSAENGKDNGCIINTVMQVTSNPLMLAIAVNKNNCTTGMIHNSKKFNISVLSEKAKPETFKHFGFQSGNNTDKFADFNNAERTPNGLLYITEGANAYFCCYVKEEIDLGTHYLFIAHITDSKVLSNERTITYDYYQTNIKPSFNKPEKKSGWICKICGYVYDGEILPDDFICPICKHGAIDFEKII